MTEAVQPPRSVEVVEREGGDVLVGRIPAAPAGLTDVPLPGATAYFDSSAIGSSNTIVVSDPEQAATVLERLFGSHVRDAVLTASEQPVTLPVTVTEAAERLEQYAALKWLSTGPLPLDRATLALETAVAADAVEDLLDPTDPALAEVTRMTPAILALARSLRTRGEGTAWPGLPELLDNALDALSRNLFRDDAMSAAIHHESELRYAMAAFDTGPLDWDRWDELLRGVRPAAAIHAGDEVERQQQGRGSVDWSRVPPGWLDTSEGTVHWRLEAGQGERVRVEVQVSAHRMPAGTASLARLLIDDPQSATALVQLAPTSGRPGLTFRLYTPGVGLPLATADLTPSEDGLWWRGSAEVPTRLLDDGGIFIDVSGPVRTGPRLGVAAAAAEAMRWAARGTAALRLALAGSDVERAGVREPWERARQLFSHVAAAGLDADLARRRQARCDATVLAYLETIGSTKTARIRSRLAGLAHLVLPEDIALPDLSAAGWEPTVSELALLAGGIRS